MYKTIHKFYPDVGLMSELFLKDVVLRSGKLMVNISVWPVINAIAVLFSSDLFQLRNQKI